MHARTARHFEGTLTIKLTASIFNPKRLLSPNEVFTRVAEEIDGFSAPSRKNATLPNPSVELTMHAVFQTRLHFQKAFYHDHSAQSIYHICPYCNYKDIYSNKLVNLYIKQSRLITSMPARCFCESLIGQLLNSTTSQCTYILAAFVRYLRKRGT